MGEKRRRAQALSARPAADREWIGGRLLSPMVITGEGEPYRPELILWFELPDQLIVCMEVVDPERPVAFGETLRTTMEAPAAGAPRRPGRIRVADGRLAAEVRAAVPDLEVVVGPTPELDRVVERMARSMPRDSVEPSYFEEGRVSAEEVVALFEEAARLWRAAPWKVADDDHVLRMDIPALGVEGAALSIIGALGESYGVIIFPSLKAYDRFLATTDHLPSRGRIDLGTTLLSLDFSRAVDLSERMRREIATHGWPVASPAAYPQVQQRDRDGMQLPHSAREVRIATACAAALVAFVAKHRALFATGRIEPVWESYIVDDDGDLEVRLTFPYKAARRLGAQPRQLSRASPADARERAGRNDPCPCGSGRKYKRCCLEKDLAAPPRGASPVHELDNRLVEELVRFGQQRFGRAWIDRAASCFLDPEASQQLFEPWLVFHTPIEGQTVAEHFLEQRSRRSQTESAWLRAQQAAWLSVWEVLAVEPGRSLTLRDLLSGQERTAQEVSASRDLAVRHGILARVVDFEESSVLCGCHQRPLPPTSVIEVVEAARRRLRRKRDVPVERLREERSGRLLIRDWEDEVELFDERAAAPPMLHTTDGDELVLTVDHFVIAPGAREEVARRLGEIEGVEAVPDAQDGAAGERAFRVLRAGNAMHASWESTLVGRIVVGKDVLRAETSSLPRADDLRRRIEAACGERATHRLREISDPRALLQHVGESGAQHAGDGEGEEVPEEVRRLILEQKRAHYATWPDEPLPALGGRTPRQAIETPEGRAEVDLLLKDCEHHAAQGPAWQRFDFSTLRAELALD